MRGKKGREGWKAEWEEEQARASWRTRARSGSVGGLTSVGGVAALVAGAVLFTRYPLLLPPLLLLLLLLARLPVFFLFLFPFSSCFLFSSTRPWPFPSPPLLPGGGLARFSSLLPFSLPPFLPSHPSPWPLHPKPLLASRTQYETPLPTGKTISSPSSITQRTALQMSYGSSNQNPKKQRKRSGVTKVCPLPLPSSQLSFLPPSPLSPLLSPHHYVDLT